MTSLAQAVFERWRALGIDRDGVPAGALDALAAARGFALPASFRALWMLSDGTATMDADEHIFWPLDNVAGDPSLGDPTIVVFADWRLCAIVFGLDATGAVTAYRHGSTPERVVAETFDRFLEIYLADPAALSARR